jgi:hypothetical protein
MVSLFMVSVWHDAYFGRLAELRDAAPRAAAAGRPA